MENIDNIADYFIWFANEHGDLITHLKLQKLCYFAEAFYLAKNKKPLTGESFEAWAHGPVSRTLWKRLKKYKHHPVNDEVLPAKEEDYCDIDNMEDDDCEDLICYYQPDLDEPIKEHLQSIIDRFWGKSAWELECETHDHEPWQKARGFISLDTPCTEELQQEDMISFYAKDVQDEE